MDKEMKDIKDRAERNRLIDKKHFVWAFKTSANLYKALQMLQSMGLTSNKETDEGLVNYIEESLKNSTFIALSCMNQHYDEELSKSVFFDFINRYNQGYVSDEDIIHYRNNYKKYSGSSKSAEQEYDKIDTKYKYYCSECVKHKINESCDEECLQRKEELRKRLLLLDRVIVEQ